MCCILNVEIAYTDSSGVSIDLLNHAVQAVQKNNQAEINHLKFMLVLTSSSYHCSWNSALHDLSCILMDWVVFSIFLLFLASERDGVVSVEGTDWEGEGTSLLSYLFRIICQMYFHTNGPLLQKQKHDLRSSYLFQLFNILLHDNIPSASKVVIDIAE